MFDGACQTLPNREQKHLVVGDPIFGNSDISAIFGESDSQQIEIQPINQRDNPFQGKHYLRQSSGASLIYHRFSRRIQHTGPPHDGLEQIARAIIDEFDLRPCSQ